MPDGNKTGLNNTTSGVLGTNLFGRKYLRMKKITCIFLPFPYEIFKVTPLVAGQQHKQPFVPNGRGRKNSNLATLNRAPTITKKTQQIRCQSTLGQPHFACINDEVKCVISYVNPALFTETWLGDSTIENHLHISGYHLTARNRTTGPQGGVGLYTDNNPKFKSLKYLQDPDFETMWTWLQPTRLPRGISCRIAVTVQRLLQHQLEVNFRAAAFSSVATLKGFNIRRLRSYLRRQADQW